ncbi:MAG TPA: carboxypeptidase-like regulatory domain-containing protein, partial [Acidobacteriaceae bacterium]|nr:carboxypeptidase-like regulatory domain-containing protein [Acidobacteriaceae bacterium]
MKLSKILFAGLFACASVLLTPRGWSQAVTATVVGTVSDSSGAVVPGATVTLTNEGTGAVATQTTNASGNYEFPLISPGSYTVGITAKGFKAGKQTDIAVQVNTTRRVDMTLQAGSATEVVTVTGLAPMLQTDRADVTAQIDAVQVEDLPVGSQRNFQALESIVPGVSRPIYDHSSFFDSQNSQSLQVNGQSEESNNLQFEGIDDNERTGLLQVYIPPAAAIQTVDVETSNYAPEFGRSAGAVTNVTLKSGTNRFHGSAYEYNQVSALQARDYFNRTGAKQRTTNNYYGFALGGPIVKNHTFFFGDFLRYSNHQNQFNLISVPTAAFRSGDLSAGPTSIYDPGTGNADGTGRTQFSYQGKANVIDPSRLAAIPQKILALVPLPNVPGAGFTNNYQKNTGFFTDVNTFDI